MERDLRVRLAAFEWLRSQVDLHGDVLPRATLARGFEFEGVRVPLMGPQGIFKPAILDRIPISITTSPKGPYSDRFGPDGLLRYAYRGTDPDHHENVGLRAAMEKRVPLVYFHGTIPGRYLAAWPVFIVGDDPGLLRFTAAMDDVQVASGGLVDAIGEPVATVEGRRAYITTTLKRRLHQQAFRDRVLRAYRRQCALCRLRHEELLDAAHIIGDTEEGGDPVVPNGLALCKLHHAAFDRYFLGIRPDHVIEIRQDVLSEEDGPMLMHGLKGMHLQRIVLPGSRRDHPDPDRLAVRYQRFRQAG